MKSGPYLSKGWAQRGLHLLDEEGSGQDAETGKVVKGGCYCISGALHRAIVEVDGGTYAPQERTYAPADIQDFVEKHGLTQKQRESTNGIIQWNDHSRRTKAQVVRCLEKAAEKAATLGV